MCSSDLDDDGVAIFWREDVFNATAIDFLSFNDAKRNQGAVRVDLVRKCDGAPLTAITTHLSSGTKDKDRAARINECSAPSVDAKGALKAPSLREWLNSQTTPTLLCVDTNEPPLPKITDSGGDSQGDNTVWSILRNGDDVRSVWDDYFNPDGSHKIRGRGHTLVTTNKMRGPLSDQPDKIGEHVFAAIDHIFYGDGSQTGALDAWRLSLLGHTWQPLEYLDRKSVV